MNEIEQKSSLPENGPKAVKSESPFTGSVLTPTEFNLEEISRFPILTFKTYVQTVAILADEIQSKYGIYKTVPIIQSAHESAYGNSLLARKHGNLFGITATDGWKKKGMPVADMPTWEEVDITEKNYPEWSAKNSSYDPQILRESVDPSGNKHFRVKITLKREFRHYPSWRNSFDDWGRLISGYSGYSHAYQLLKNKVTAPEGISEMGRIYATDERYAISLLRLWAIIEPA